MSKQVIITIGREFGSGGHEVAERLAKELGLKLYDRSMLDEIAREKNVESGSLGQYDEKPRNVILTRRVGEHSSAMEDHVANMQFDFLRKKADEGESFVVVGRCSEYVLKDYPVVSFFIIGDTEQKIKRIMEHFELSEADAVAKMKRHDKKRKQYHNTYAKIKWGDSRAYDLCINSSKIGIQKTVELIQEYLKIRE